MEEKRNYVGLMSVRKHELNPFFDVKNQNEGTQVLGLVNSLLIKQLTPITTCNLDDRDGIFILDGVQRWKYMQEGSFIKCYHLGIITEEEAIRNWFSLHNTLTDNILKILDVVKMLTIEMRQEVSRISYFSNQDLEDILKLSNFDFFAYIEKHQKEEPVQQSLFD